MQEKLLKIEIHKAPTADDHQTYRVYADIGAYTKHVEFRISGADATACQPGISSRLDYELRKATDFLVRQAEEIVGPIDYVELNVLPEKTDEPQVVTLKGKSG